ncbi:MAG: cupredoxin domain-containing protein [Deltaproteobacteria bacterium]|nr:cupredoxin domain-containing protein [Deltaproteobacteria bacterium]
MTHFAKSLLLIAALLCPTIASAQAAQTPPTQPESAVREVEIAVNGAYSPAVINVTEGERLRLVFIRQDYSPCSREVVFPSLNLRRMLPTNERVVIELPALSVGEHPFQCWMNMLRGRIVVAPRVTTPPPATTPPVTRPPRAPRARRR